MHTQAFSKTPHPETKKKTGTTPFFQAKLRVNTPGDAHEQEADQVADQVMRMQEDEEPMVQRKSLTPRSSVQRMCADCEEKQEGKVQRQETGSNSTGGQTAPPIVSQVLSSGGGRPMDRGTRQFMEQRFGQDFGQVRIHTGGQAAESASAIQAKAYTSGKDIVFGAGEYRPESGEGKRLLAHELVHVGQQVQAQQRHSLSRSYQRMVNNTVSRKGGAKDGAAPKGNWWDSYGMKGHELVNKDFQSTFPGDIMPFSGMGYGNVQGLEVEKDLFLRIGESYVKEQDDNNRSAMLTAAVEKTHDLKMASKTMDNNTLKNERMNDRLRGLKKTDMESYRTSAQSYAKDKGAQTDQLQDFLSAGQVISTPLMSGATLQRDASTSAIQGILMNLGTFFIHILPDAVTSKAGKGAETKFTHPFVKSFKFSLDTKREKLTTWPKHLPSKITVTIQTFFNKDAQPDSTSAYGRGTTTQDKQRGATTLRFHEGSHGKDYIEFLKANPLPLFGVGMLKKDLDRAMSTLGKIGEYSDKHTDQVGSPTEADFKKSQKK